MTAEPTAADLRAVAVARLKRAASLPRMKDGRRPAMRDDAVVSEGDKAPMNQDGDVEDRPPLSSENATDVEGSPPLGPSSVKADDSTAVTEDEPPASGRDTPSKRRRGRSRSRSRSRSRGSKDFKEAKAELFRPTDSSPEELPPIPPFFQPTLASPIPSHFTNMPFPARNFFTSPSPNPLFHSPASPPPTLDALREGLIRSNSARQMAMHKLTGGRDSPTTPTPSTTPPPFRGMGRSNTVTGVERSAARNLMLRRLEKRAPPKDGGESELTSGTDDTGPANLPSGPTSNAAQSKRASPAMSNVIDDRDLPGSPSESPRATPSPLPGAPSSISSAERGRQETLAKLTGDDPFEYDSPSRRPQPPLFAAAQRGVVIEEDELDGHLELPQPIPRHLNGSSTPPSRNDSPRSHIRTNKMSEISSVSSMTGTDIERVPLFLQEEGQKSPYAQDTFPVTISPVGTPSRDKEPLEDDTTEDDVVYRHPEEMRDRKAFLARQENAVESKLSWIGFDDGINLNYNHHANPELESELEQLPVEPVNEMLPEVKEEDEEEQEVEIEIEDQAPIDDAPRTSSTPRINLPSIRADSSVPFQQSSDARASRDGYSSSIIPETPSTTDTFEQHSASEKPSEDDMPPPAISRLSTSSSSSMVLVEKLTPARIDRGNSDVYSEWEDGQTDAAQTDREGLTDYEGRPERSPSRIRKKRESNNSGATSRWEKLKSLGGRRSRSNSFARTRKDDAPASSPHRESGASAKSDQSNPAAGPSSQLSQPGPQMHSSSASLLSMAASAVPPPREGLSPVPPISQAGMARYTDPKLMPLPGIMRLEAERRRTRKTSLSAASDAPDTVPNTRVNSPEPALLHQSSDSRLLLRYRAGGEVTHPGDEIDYEDLGGRTTPGYIDIVPLVTRSPTPNSGSYSKNALPQTKEAALKWIQRRREGKSSENLANGAISDSNTIRPGGGKRKIALSDLLASARGNDSGTEREDRSAAATPRPGGKRRGTFEQQLRKFAGSPTETSSYGYSMSSSSPRSEKPVSWDRAPSDRMSSERPSLDEPVDLSRRVNGHVSAASTSSSISNASESLSPTLGQFPTTPPLNIARSPTSPTHPTTPIKSAMAKPSLPKVSALMQHFTNLVEDPANPTLESFQLGTTPRKFIKASVVRQVVSPNEVKNRFLLLFNDILVVAKFHDDDFQQPSLDRRLVVRNIVELRTASIQLPQNRSHEEYIRLPSIKDFVRDFTNSPEEAISRCTQRTGLARDPATIASLLFKTSGLDPRSLTAYLARRSNKATLKAFLDRFGFKGMRVDTALRLFLVVMRMPQDKAQVEHLLAYFASRWFEANKGVVSFDREMTMRLVMAMMQLNDILHHTAEGARPVTPSSSRIMSRDFIYDFRLMDPHMYVTDDLLQRIYVSVRNERFVQGLDTPERDQELSISFSTPPSLVARVTSESVTIRIPAPDPHFRIHLHGQDLFFDPPTLEFARSNVATFVIIGSTLGRKDMILVRSGANAARYAGLPLSCPLTVDRPFMPNTFTVTFPSIPNPQEPKSPARQRMYRFNLVDETEHHAWVADLQRLIGTLRDQPPSLPDGVNSPFRPVQRATDVVALQALRDALVDTGDHDREDETVGPGRFAQHTEAPKPEPLKGNDLVSACEQNSLIPAMLSFLQAAKHPNGEPKGVGGLSNGGGGVINGGANVTRNGSRVIGRI